MHSLTKIAKSFFISFRRNGRRPVFVSSIFCVFRRISYWNRRDSAQLVEAITINGIGCYLSIIGSILTPNRDSVLRYLLTRFIVFKRFKSNKLTPSLSRVNLPHTISRTIGIHPLLCRNWTKCNWWGVPKDPSWQYEG